MSRATCEVDIAPVSGRPVVEHARPSAFTVLMYAASSTRP
jgi:hypothetical protein